MNEFFNQLLLELRNAGWTEYLGIVAGIGSVWLSKRENIWVYPVGLINTVIYSYLCLDRHLFGEAAVNVYYTVMSIYGWIIWARRNERKEHVLQVTESSAKEWGVQVLFFAGCYIVLYLALSYLKQLFYPTLPAADAFASATAFTGMWLMARKKVESWYWWIATNAASMPLFYIKGLRLTSVLYFILLIMAFYGLADWKRRAKKAREAAMDPAIHG
jgi:nicotinamide mononucleotide transporter